MQYSEIGSEVFTKREILYFQCRPISEEKIFRMVPTEIRAIALAAYHLYYVNKTWYPLVQYTVQVRHELGSSWV